MPTLMRLRIDELTEESRECSFETPVGELSRDSDSGARPEFVPSEALRATVQVSRSGDDLLVSGHLEGRFEGSCARCLGVVPTTLAFDFETVLVPAVEEPHSTTQLGADDLTLGYYSGEELELGSVCVEHMLLELPTRALCGPHCQGLCSSCGVNLNEETCTCSGEPRDPRLAVLQGLRVGGGSRGREASETN